MAGDLNIPKHVAIILDGNGRWAKKRKLPRTYGHARGAKTVEKILRYSHKIGIKYVTLYAFSTENWNRPQDEVSTLMKLLSDYIDKCTKNFKKDNMIIRFIGDIKGLPVSIQDKARSLELITKDNTGLNLNIAINYGARNELVRTIKGIASDIKQSSIDIEDIDESFIDSRLDTYNIPDPDLLIRTSGEIRLSNFLLWQLAYTEFYFTDVLWPDFEPNDLDKAIIEYNNRNRKFGKTLEQMEE